MTRSITLINDHTLKWCVTLLCFQDLKMWTPRIDLEVPDGFNMGWGHLGEKLVVMKMNGENNNALEDNCGTSGFVQDNRTIVSTTCNFRYCDGIMTSMMNINADLFS